MRRSYLVLSLSAALLFAAPGMPAVQLPSATAAKIDEIAAKALIDSGAPSVSIAIVQGAKVAFGKACGKARLDPSDGCQTGNALRIGSVGKQFLAGAILLLVQDGKLSLDDSRLTLPSQPYSGISDRHPPVTLAHLRIPGLLPARLCGAVHANAGDCRKHSRPIGRKAAGFRSRHALAIQQHELRGSRPDCGASDRRPVLRLPVQAHPATPGPDERHRFGPADPGAARRRWLHAVCAGARSPGANGGPRLALCGRGASHDGARLGSLGRLSDGA